MFSGYELKTGHYILVGRGFSPLMPGICSKGGLKPRPTVFKNQWTRLISIFKHLPDYP